MQKPEIRARAVELALQHSKNNGGYHSADELIEMARKFEEYLSEGYIAPYPYPMNTTPLSAPYVSPYPTATPYVYPYQTTTIGNAQGVGTCVCGNNCSCNAGDCNQGC